MHFVQFKSQFWRGHCQHFKGNIKGAFHHVKDSGNFDSSSNEKVRFGSFRPEFQDHFLRWSRHSARNFLTEISCSISTNRFISLVLLTSVKNSEQELKNAKSHPSWLALFDRKIVFHFPRICPLVSDRSLRHDGKRTLCYLI